MVNISIRRIIAGFSLMILLTVNYGCSNENAHDIPTNQRLPKSHGMDGLYIPPRMVSNCRIQKVIQMNLQKETK